MRVQPATATPVTARRLKRPRIPITFSLVSVMIAFRAIRLMVGFHRLSITPPRPSLSPAVTRLHHAYHVMPTDIQELPPLVCPVISRITRPRLTPNTRARDSLLIASPVIAQAPGRHRHGIMTPRISRLSRGFMLACGVRALLVTPIRRPMPISPVLLVISTIRRTQIVITAV